MNNKRCANCGCVYNTDIYGDLCPLCHSKRIESASPEQEIGHSAYHEEIPCVYGPPIKRKGGIIQNLTAPSMGLPLLIMSHIKNRILLFMGHRL